MRRLTRKRDSVAVAAAAVDREDPPLHTSVRQSALGGDGGGYSGNNIRKRTLVSRLTLIRSAPD